MSFLSEMDKYVDRKCGYDCAIKARFIKGLIWFFLLVVCVVMIAFLGSSLKKDAETSEKAWEEVHAAIDSGYDIYVNGILLDDEEVLAEGFTSSTYRILSVDHEKETVSLEIRNRGSIRFLPVFSGR